MDVFVLLFTSLFALAVHAQTSPLPYFKVIRAPVTEEVARSYPTDQICTAIYEINLRPEFTTQGNDIGMLQPHGKNTSGYGTLFNESFFSFPNLGSIGFDYSNYPYPQNATLQARAKSMFSVTALTEADGTPLGFKLEMMRMYYSVCVRVRGVYNRWVEVMAQTPQPDRKVCVSDWRPDVGGRTNLNVNPFQSTCGQGHLYACRSSPNENNASLPMGFEDNMNVRFYCENCDDESFTFYWRVVAMQLTPKKTSSGQYVQPDGENFCLYRSGTDFPSSLLQPYPQDYVPPPVFETVTSSASTATAALWVLAVLVLAVLAL